MRLFLCWGVLKNTQERHPGIGKPTTLRSIATLRSGKSAQKNEGTVLVKERRPEKDVTSTRNLHVFQQPRNESSTISYVILELKGLSSKLDREMGGIECKL